MKETNNEQQVLREFAEFIETGPLNPGEQVNEVVIKMVARDLRPAMWRVYSKFTLVEVAAGLATLAICPQFGLGFGQHNQFLHALHSTTPPVIFYLLCGLLFVILGAVLSGLVLNRDEVRSIGNNKYLYFAVYSLLAYFCLMSLGSEAFVAVSLAWLPGAMLGNLIGFESLIRLRRAVS